MDGTLATLVDHVHSVRPGDLSERTAHEVVRHVLDTVGCGAGGFDSAPARITRAAARGVTGPMCASVYGEPLPVLVDHAALANATADRYLDFNDFGLSGHPSDMIPAVLAVGEAAGSTGAEVVAAVHLAYEIATALAEQVSPTTGWDQGAVSSLGVAGALAALLRLDRERTAHAFSLAIVPSVPLKVTRYGELSSWKAAAVPHATMSATLAVRLAAEGMTGPPEPFEGRCGMFEQAWEPFELTLGGDTTSAIERSSLKAHAACYWAQVGIDLGVELRERVGGREITSVDVATTAQAFRTIGGGVGDREQKWRPATRETADHSMAFLVASALMDGGVGDESFRNLAEPRRVDLMRRIDVREDAGLTGRATRDRCPTSLRVTLAGGEVLESTHEVPRGHPRRPMSDDEVWAKFRSQTEGVLATPAIDALGEVIWGLRSRPDLSELGASFREFGNVSPRG